MGWTSLIIAIIVAILVVAKLALPATIKYLQQLAHSGQSAEAKNQPLDPGIRKLIGIIAFAFFWLPGLLSGGLLGYLVDNQNKFYGAIILGLAGALLGAAIYVFKGLVFVEQNKYLVIERFKIYARTLNRGPHILCLPGLVDRVAPHGGEGTYELRVSKLFASGEKIDFADGVTARVDAELWWSVSDPFHYVYVVEETEERTVQLAENFLRPRLSILSSEKARENSITVATDTVTELKPSVSHFGINIDERKGVTIADIVLDKETEDARRQEKEAEFAAKADIKRGEGEANAFMAFWERIGKDVPREDAWRMYLERETLRGIDKARIVLSGPGSAAQMSLLVTGEDQPKERIVKP